MKWVVFSFLVMCMFSTLAQPCSTLRGVVVDANTSENLPGASVYVLKSKTLGVATDVNGAFELNVTGVDTLVVSFIGYKEERRILPDSCSIRIPLVSTQTKLNEIVIQSERLIAEEFTIKKIKKLDIYTNPSAKADPLLAVNATPSATTTDESANISLRGSSAAETGIFLNNVPINDAVRYSQLNGIGTFSIFNTALVNNVQVYPGNPPLEFGNTTSGLISLQTDEIVPVKSSNSLSITMAGLGLYRQQRLNNKSSITLFSNYQPSVVLKAMNKRSLRDITFSSIDFGIHYFRKLNEKTSLKLFSYGIRESYSFQYAHPTYSGPFDQKKNRGFTIANVRHGFKNSELSLNTGINISSANYVYSTTDIRLKLNDFFTSLNYQYFGGKAEFKVGLSYDYRNADYKGQYPLFGYAIGEQYPTAQSSGYVSLHLPEGFFYLKYFVAPKWTLGIGIRKNVAIDTRSYISSQVNLNFKPTKQWNIILSAGRYNKYQLPQGEQSSLQLIQSDQYSADFSYTKAKFESSFSLYYKNGSYPDYTYSIKGLEFYTRFRIRSNFKTQLSITCLDATQKSEGITTVSPYDIHYFLRGSFEYKINGTWTITTVVLLRQGSFYKPVSGTQYDSDLQVYQPQYGDFKRLPSYNLVDLSISKMFLMGKKHSAVVFGSVGNVIDFKNVSGYSYNFDYTLQTEELFSLRTVFFGTMFNF